MYRLCKQIGNGEFVCVALHDNFEEAVPQVQALKEHWPGEYEVRDSVTEVVSYKWTATMEVVAEARV
jgi:hypothetical protein